MTLTGKDALELYERIKRENRIKQVQQEELLARAKEDAVACGKEPFDFAKLQTMCAIQALGPLGPDEGAGWFERMYYLDYPRMMTLADLAKHIDELAVWW